MKMHKDHELLQGIDARPRVVSVCESDLALSPLFAGEADCLCLITGVEGTSYRPVGAGMAVADTGARFGNLSSGCIDEDVALHGIEALQSGAGKTLRYGAGSPFMDLKLPCGGGLDVTLIPTPEPEVLSSMQTRLQARTPVTVSVSEEGRLVAGVADGASLILTVKPRLRALIFGSGEEPRHFARLAQAADLSVTTYLSDASGPYEHLLIGNAWPEGETPDGRTAVAVFFHDHDRETALLSHALRSDAFYIGAQGSERARTLRSYALQANGLSEADIARMVQPFGYIRRAKSPRDLAVGVLAQVLDHGRAR
ncbi:XdhC family protein [Celeribacter litoreus]|uniref:XdhC family protein n=1 Tax=Celeribacter litoreus TaxID=2876714 RepID=UPI001CCC1350|nr:XdhC family protein [Celeribacter litoreus]MCA0043341.1 XdhC family protein [Celeribacter litoreus]